VVRRLEAA